MYLDSRKMKILKAIIQTYLETGEPVGSRTISRYGELNVSSATIRNEMADLEEMGLIIQPHTSAGRIPTDQGYRLYVDELMDEKVREMSSLQHFFNTKMDHVESMLKDMARLLARDTNYAAMISAPRYLENEIRLIQLSRLDAYHIVTVVVMEGNVVRNHVITVESPVTEADILRLNILLNSALDGKTLDEISLSLIRSLKEQAGDNREVVMSILEAISESITNSREEKPEIYTSGATNIFKYPELSDNTNASGIISAFEEKDQLISLVNESKDKDHEIQVYIGKEAPIRSMQDCSIVTANYELGKGMRGTIGIIGPKRMDYEHVVSTLKTLMSELDRIYHDEE